MSLPQHLSLSALLLLASPLSAAKGPFSRPQLPCRVVPGSPDWPSATSWARFNESTGGRLLRPSPPGAVCHPGQPAFDAAECAAVNASWSSYEFHSASPVSVDWNNWANDSCLPWDGYPCSSQGYPVFVVNASTARHVKAGVDFAAKHGIRLVVKSTGHDYIGRSNAPNSLSIWTHHLKLEPQTHTSFHPKNCKASINTTAVTVGAGTQMDELYSFLDTLNQTTVGGGGKTVSMGGYLTGGGHGLLAPRYGLAADQVLELGVVTPTGQIVTANECTNPELFWALRGGGGSTFGILTSVTLRTFPTPKITSRLTIIVTTNLTEPAVFDMVAYVLSQFPSLGDQGLSGYSYFFPAFPNPFDGGNTTVAGLVLSMVLQDSTSAAMDKLWNPITSHIDKTWPDAFQTVQVPDEYPSFYAWFEEHYDTTAAGTNTVGGSRLLGEDELTANLTLNAQVFRQFASNGVGTAFLVAGKGVHDAEPRGGGNAANPAWRRAYVHASKLLTPNGVEFPPLNLTAKREAMARLDHSLTGIRELAPTSGAYMNEANPEEPDWQHQFWGENYEKL
ncbi:hypothetical protein OQA88_4969 [Cercophora sp. LCS_1]